MPTERQKLNLLDFVPAGWFKEHNLSSVWLSGFRAFRVQAALSEGYAHFDMGDVQAVLIHGSVPYWSVKDFRVDWQGDSPVFEVSGASQVQPPAGFYLILLAPHDRDGIKGDEGRTKARISATVGMLAAIFGRNIVFLRVFDNVLELSDGRTHSFSPTIENPLAFPPVDATDTRRRLAQQLFASLATLSSPQRNLVELSLRWYEQALFDSGTDAFIKFWIAIETLAMPNITNIRAIDALLATAYGIDEQSVRSAFKIGRIFGLRGRIVHDGAIVPIHSELMAYLEALYVDVLYACLSVPIERRAATILARSDFDLESYLQED
ncbi:MAG: HEPN domain-containing protein [Reyranella sp.]|nr:HEPN domain-containing protein [Reyranella sp.]MDP3160839.1 HEPN domain-containing protein [Reyranella sp.]